MTDSPTYRVSEQLTLLSGPNNLAKRLNRLQPEHWIRPGKAEFGLPGDYRRYPLVPDGKLQFKNLYEAHPEPRKGNLRFYLPPYRLKTQRIGRLNLPKIRFRWLATRDGSVQEGEELAELDVELEPMLRGQSNVDARVMKHDLRLDLQYFSVDQQGRPTHRVRLPFERMVSIGGGDQVATLVVRDLESLARLVRAMTKESCRAVFRLEASAQVYVPRVQYVVGLNTRNSARFHEALWKTDLQAQSVLSSRRLRKHSVKPFAKSNRPVAFSSGGGTGTGPISPVVDRINRPGGFDFPFRPGRIRRDTAVFNPNLIGGIADRIDFQPAVTAFKLNPAALTALRNPSLAALPHRVRLPDSTALSVFLKGATVADQDQDKQAIKKDFAASPFRIGRRRALLPVGIKAADGKKVLIRKETTAQQRLPAEYPVENYGQIYGDIPDPIMDRIRGLQDPTVLIAFNISVGGRNVVVYQDPVQPNLFYYAPETFKLGRADNPPYEPLLRLLFKELLLEGESEDEVDLNYRVEVTFTALPHVERDFYAAARSDGSLQAAAAGEPVVLAPLDGGEASLELTAVTRGLNGEITDTLLSLSSAVMVTFEVASEDFDRFFAGLTVDSGEPALRGKISAPSLSADVDLSLSLYDVTGPVFSQHWSRSPEDPQGLYRVWLKNETESEVRVHGSRAWIQSDGPPASGTVVGEDARFTLSSGATREVRVNVSPADAVVRDIEIETRNSFHLNLEALWPLITVSQGLSSYAYEIEVIAEYPELFGQSPGGDVPPLTALKVEFQEGAEVRLTEAQHQTTATLYKSVLADLQNQPLTETYSYRVTNVHGNQEWARGNWIRSQGTLRIGPVSPEQP